LRLNGFGHPLETKETMNERNLNAKYESLAQSCFGKPFHELDLDERITVKDLYDEKNK
jgi:hypothetical protein